MIGEEGADSCGISESRNEERLLRPKSEAFGSRYIQEDALISAKTTEIRQIAIFVLRLAHRPPHGKRAPGTEINIVL
ncbi:hypothetical protein BI350_11765 [Sporosarcina ureilytica]|uniref:Uncharacterized protein n=1 Tax=Sporosarcina ureilytica TaxID=298596 RepID=A0A1D8JHG3_9BACL|nr:hypothetical protein BI350_11765 [Sporosarcina ureilytica]